MNSIEMQTIKAISDNMMGNPILSCPPARNSNGGYCCIHLAPETPQRKGILIPFLQGKDTAQGMGLLASMQDSVALHGGWNPAMKVAAGPTPALPFLSPGTSSRPTQKGSSAINQCTHPSPGCSTATGQCRAGIEPSVIQHQR